MANSLGSEGVRGGQRGSEGDGTGTGTGVEGLVDGNIVKRIRVKANYPPRLDFRRRNTSDAQIGSSRKVDTLA